MTTIRASLLAGGVGVGLLLLTLAGPSGELGGGVVLNPDPPEPPRWGLEWHVAELPKPARQAVEPPPAQGDFGDAGEPAPDKPRPGADAAPVVDPYAG